MGPGPTGVADSIAVDVLLGIDDRNDQSLVDVLSRSLASGPEGKGTRGRRVIDPRQSATYRGVELCSVPES
jgi:hypothetical protein